jgi:two-component system, NtrC family, response regulator GlrR
VRDTEPPRESDIGLTTERVQPDSLHSVQRFNLVGVDTANEEIRWSSDGERCSIGSHVRNDLVLEDPAVSRFHCELMVDRDGIRVRDLGSSNGTVLDGVPVIEAYCRGGSTLKIGRSSLRVELDPHPNRLVLSPHSELGTLVGISMQMRQMFAVIERVAPTASTVLIEGETGTGKEGTAQAIHQLSPRANGPFVVVDCGAIPGTIIESELFGHEKGSFTGAHARQTGAFEEANGGTLFLDEIGELDLEMQPKLLRVLERREIRRLGAPAMIPIDVRVLAATHRDLRAEVNAGRFRSDLYYRLAVVKVHAPPLRSRPDDLPLLVERFLRDLHAGEEALRTFLDERFLERLSHAAWPGNVRELRNYIERCLVFEEPQPLDRDPKQSAAPDKGYQGPRPVPASWASLSYDEGRRRALDEFEAGFVQALLRQHGGKVAQAARASGVDRAYLYRLMKKHHLGG